MQRDVIAARWGIIALVLALVVPASLHAQARENFTDLRGRSYTEEDLARSLFEQPSSDVRTRGIGPVAPKPVPLSSTPENPSVALNVFFDFNSDKILQAYYGDLDKLGRVLTTPQYRAYHIQIEGYTDNIGSDSYNQRLSERRAHSVKRYLMQHFPISSERLAVKGYGESKPIASNDTSEGRDKNRRVEVVNLGIN